MNVEPRLYERLVESGDDNTRAKIIAEAFAQLGDHTTQRELMELEYKLRQVVMETEFRLEKKIAESKFDQLRWLALVACVLETFVIVTLLVVLIGK